MTASSGVAIDIHYCMGKESGVDLYKTRESDKCDKCGMTGKTGCCKSDHHFYKMEDGYKIVVHSYDFTSPYHYSPIHYFDFSQSSEAVVYKVQSLINSPPGSSPPIFLRNRNFRI